MKRILRAAALTLAAVVSLGMLAACGASGGTTVRSFALDTTSLPTIPHIALVAFEEFIESKLGDKYNVKSTPANCWAPRLKWCS